MRRGIPSLTPLGTGRLYAPHTHGFLKVRAQGFLPLHPLSVLQYAHDVSRPAYVRGIPRVVGIPGCTGGYIPPRVYRDVQGGIYHLGYGRVYREGHPVIHHLGMREGQRGAYYSLFLWEKRRTTRRVLLPVYERMRDNEARTTPCFFGRLGITRRVLLSLMLLNVVTTRRVLRPFFGRIGREESPRRARE